MDGRVTSMLEDVFLDHTKRYLCGKLTDSSSLSNQTDFYGADSGDVTNMNGNGNKGDISENTDNSRKASDNDTTNNTNPFSL